MRLSPRPDLFNEFCIGFCNFSSHPQGVAVIYFSFIFIFQEIVSQRRGIAQTLKKIIREMNLLHWTIKLCDSEETNPTLTSEHILNLWTNLVRQYLIIKNNLSGRWDTVTTVIGTWVENKLKHQRLQHSEDSFLFADATLATLMQQICPQVQSFSLEQFLPVYQK